MKLSFNLLKQFVNLDNISPFDVADRLTYAGIEVENVYKLSQATNLVVGKIISCENHKDSDHLHVLQVDLGNKYGIKQIVCGAPNARKDLKVIVAMVGAKLPNDVTINQSCIRGVESNGMCCSLLELGVDKKFLNESQINGIEEVNDDLDVGSEDILSYYGLDDYILEVNILANRPDLLSIYNMAKEVGALFKKEVIKPKIINDKSNKSTFKVNSLTDKCRQFSIKEIYGIKNNISPRWLKNYLMSSNIRSIDALVDIGNFVMLVTGQPLHMYDKDKLNSNSLVVKDDYQGDFVALDDKTYQLINGDIVITNDDEVMCLGGVMGAKKCEVDSNTKNVVIEAASFHHASIRHTSQRLGLASESSQRFVKGTNHFQYDFVLNYTYSLIKEICGIDNGCENVNYINETYNPIIISTSKDKINSRLGSNFSNEDIKEVLSLLHFEVIGDNIYQIKVPSYRLDVTCDADISEEVIRYLGFDNIESSLPKLKQSVGHYSIELENNQKIENYLTNQGLINVLTYSLISEKQIKEFDYLYQGQAYKILNPLTDIHQYVRKSVMPSLIETALYNINHQNKDFMLYEISNIITNNDQGINLGIILSGKRNYQDLLINKDVNFYTLKGLLESLMTLFNINKGRYNIIRNNKIDSLHPLQSALINIEGKNIGYFGLIHPTYQKQLGLEDKEKLFILELRLDKLYQLKTSTNKMKPISKFPYVERDLAFIVKKDVQVEDVIKSIKQISHGLIYDVKVFDIYENISNDNMHKSIALKIYYQSQQETLKDDTINALETKIIETIIKKFNATLRN